MVFSNKISKFGKGENISLFMETSEKINVYYFKDGVFKKELQTSNSNITLGPTINSYPFNEVIQVEDFLITRIDKSIGITKDE